MESCKMEEKVSKVPKNNSKYETKKKKNPPVELTFDEKTSLLSMLYPKSKAKGMNPRKKYVCAVCKSSCDLYGLFLHMKQVHSGLLCCYCTKLFKKVSDLEIHIKTTHRVAKRYYHNTKQFSQISGQKYNFVCYGCSEVLSYKDLDKCKCRNSAEFKKQKQRFDCPFCSRIFDSQKQLDIHLSNGWCKEMHWLSDPSKEDSRKIFKVLTGKDADPSIFDIKAEKQTVPKHKNAKKSADKPEAALPSVKLTLPALPALPPLPPQQLVPLTESPQYNTYKKPKKEVKIKKAMTQKEAMETKENTEQQKLSTSLKLSIPSKKERKSERLSRLAKEIHQNFAKIRTLLDVLSDSSTFCQQAHHVNVDAVFLLSHLLIHHDRQLIHKYLGEDAQDSIMRIKSYLRDSKSAEEVIFSYSTENQFDEKYSCSFCPSKTSTYTELFQHLDLQHGSKVLTCQLCQNIFLNYGSFRSHVCFGPNQGPNLKAKFMCIPCQTHDLSTFLDFQKHLRQTHNTCEICFTSVVNQEELSRHCVHHLQELMCMKCFMTYEDSKQFKKHLIYKHAEEAIECDKCYQKTWAHVYHFCLRVNGPQICEICDVNCDTFAKYRVHLRTHTGAAPHACTAKGCDKKYVSKQLLLKHNIRRHPDLRPNAAAQLEARRTKKYLEKMGASSMESVMLGQQILLDLINVVVPYEEEETLPELPPQITEPEPMETEPVEEPEPEAFDPIASAVASIMGPDGAFDIRKSPVKSYPPPEAPKPVNPPPLIPLKPTVLASDPRQLSDPRSKPESLLKSKDKPVQDPLKMMLEKENNGRTPLPPPSEVLHPNNFNEIINGKNQSSSDDSSASSEASEDENDSLEKENPENARVNPVLGGIWNQDLMFVGAHAIKDPDMTPQEPVKPKKGCKVLKPRYQIEDAKKSTGLKTSGLKSLPPVASPSVPKSKPAQWDVLLSESSGSDNEDSAPKKARIVEKDVCDKRVALLEHDYCYAVYKLAREVPEKPKEDLSEMDKLLGEVALGAFESSFTASPKEKKKKKKDGKKKKKKRKKHHKKEDSTNSSDSEVDVTTSEAPPPKKHKKKRAWRPKFHLPLAGASQGVTAAAARPHFSSSEGEDDEFLTSGGELASSDLDTDFSADENPQPKVVEQPPKEVKRSSKPSTKLKLNIKEKIPIDTPSPSLKLKIKLPASPAEPPVKKAKLKIKKKAVKKGQPKMETAQAKPSQKPTNMSQKMRESLALNRASSSSSDSSDGEYEAGTRPLTMAIPLPASNGGYIAEVAKPDTKLYCVCQSPHDAVSEMIGCDAPDCKLEWFHFECVGIMVPPEGQWYCPECTKRYNIRATY